MSTSTLTRRAALAALAAMAFAAVAASHGALARSTLRPPGIRVDVAPLAANAGEPTAGWVAQYLPGQIAQNLAEARGERQRVRSGRLSDPRVEHHRADRFVI